MSKKHYQRCTAPGLPPWPWLMFDKQQKQAVVSFRLATWRSGQQADRTSQLVVWSLTLVAGWWTWNRTAVIGNLIGQGFATFFLVVIVYMVLKALIPPAFGPFLARKLFARRSTVWFTPNEIAFRSRMYENGVVVSRSWNGHPIQIRFDMAPDPEAAEARAESPQGQGPDPRLQTAHVLRLVISAFDPRRSVSHSIQAPLARAIPMFPIDLQDARRLTVVLSAAAELTSAASIPTAQPVPSLDAGLDIDANPT